MEFGVTDLLDELHQAPVAMRLLSRGSLLGPLDGLNLDGITQCSGRKTGVAVCERVVRRCRSIPVLRTSISTPARLHRHRHRRLHG
jgi:protein gp37